MAITNITESAIHNFIIEDKILKGVKNEVMINTNQLSEMIINELEDDPDRVIQIDASTGMETTATELKEKISRCALWMTTNGIKPGDIVVICSNNNIENCIPLFATFLVGATFSGWPDDVSLDLARQLVKFYQPKLIFSWKNTIDVLREAAELENVEINFIVFESHPQIRSLKDISKSFTNEEVKNFQYVKFDNPNEYNACIILSSGSSGFPKGVMHTYERFTMNLKDQDRKVKGIRSLIYTTLYWGTCLFDVLASVLHKSTRVIHSKFSPEETCQVIEKYQVTRFWTSPTNMNYLVKSKILKKYKMESLKLVLVVGSKSSGKIFDEFKKSLPKAIVAQGYGMTETMATISNLNPKTESPHSIGFVAKNVEIKVVDVKTKESLGPNERGEMYLKTPYLSIGYYKNPEKTKEAFDEEGWYHTGDIVYYNQEGEIFFVDRVNEVIEYQGHQIFPTIVEESLLNCPSVVEAAVVSVPHEKDGNLPIAFVKVLPEHNVTKEELMELIPTIGEEKILKGGIVFVDEFPKTASLKINRPQLKKMAREIVDKE